MVKLALWYTQNTVLVLNGRTGSVARTHNTQNTVVVLNGKTGTVAHTHTYSSSVVFNFVLPLFCRYCPGCKEHQQASKKLDLWRLPEILIIHLKRFSYSRYTKNKLETFVDFPIHDLDLSKYIGHRCQDVPHNYRLYAISNHYGSLGGGHYTAYVYVSSLPPQLCPLCTSIF